MRKTRVYFAFHHNTIASHLLEQEKKDNGSKERKMLFSFIFNFIFGTNKCYAQISSDA